MESSGPRRSRCPFRDMIRRMISPLRVIAAAALCAAVGGSARAERIALTDVHAEPDLAAEAGAVNLLVRSAMTGEDRTILEAPSGLTVGAAPAVIQKLAVDHAVLMNLDREGSALRVIVAIVATEGEPDIGFVRAGDGDV